MTREHFLARATITAELARALDPSLLTDHLFWLWREQKMLAHHQTGRDACSTITIPSHPGLRALGAVTLEFFVFCHLDPPRTQFQSSPGPCALTSSHNASISAALSCASSR